MHTEYTTRLLPCLLLAFMTLASCNQLGSHSLGMVAGARNNQVAAQMRRLQNQLPRGEITQRDYDQAIRCTLTLRIGRLPHWRKRPRWRLL